MTKDQKEALAGLKGGIAAYRDCAAFAQHLLDNIPNDMRKMPGPNAAFFIQGVESSLESMVRAHKEKADNLQAMVAQAFVHGGNA